MIEKGRCRKRSVIATRVPSRAAVFPAPGRPNREHPIGSLSLPVSYQYLLGVGKPLTGRCWKSSSSFHLSMWEIKFKLKKFKSGKAIAYM